MARRQRRLTTPQGEIITTPGGGGSGGGCEPICVPCPPETGSGDEGSGGGPVLPPIDCDGCLVPATLTCTYIIDDDAIFPIPCNETSTFTLVYDAVLLRWRSAPMAFSGSLWELQFICGGCPAPEPFGLVMTDTFVATGAGDDPRMRCYLRWLSTLMWCGALDSCDPFQWTADTALLGSAAPLLMVTE
jgi:hypothetical protein